MKRKISSKWFGCLGFLGFLGFKYFWTKDPLDLYLFCFLGFFSHFFIYRILDEKEDERMIENRKKAEALSYKVAFGILFLSCILGASKIPLSKEFFSIVAALAIFTKVIVSVSAFYIYERRL